MGSFCLTAVSRQPSAVTDSALSTTSKTHCIPIVLFGGFWLFCAGMFAPAIAQQTDPLGNQVFDKSGKELYKMQATFGVLEGDSVLRRDAEFRKKTSNRNFFTFDIPAENVNHQLTVGNFLTKFSSFTLNKELFDAARWNITVPRAGGGISAFVARVTNNTFSILGERTTPIEDVDIESTSDWFMAGMRAEANLGAYDFRLGAYPEVTVP